MTAPRYGDPVRWGVIRRNDGTLDLLIEVAVVGDHGVTSETFTFPLSRLDAHAIGWALIDSLPPVFDLHDPTGSRG